MIGVIFGGKTAPAGAGAGGFGATEGLGGGGFGTGSGFAVGGGTGMATAGYSAGAESPDGAG